MWNNFWSRWFHGRLAWITRFLNNRVLLLVYSIEYYFCLLNLLVCVNKRLTIHIFRRTLSWTIEPIQDAINSNSTWLDIVALYLMRGKTIVCFIILSLCNESIMFSVVKMIMQFQYSRREKNPKLKSTILTLKKHS